MMKISTLLSSLLLGSMTFFSGCSSDNTPSTTSTYTYSITVTNITAGQPMSPLLVSSSSLFSVGASASAGLEKLAESGDNTELLNSDSVSSTQLLTPSLSETLTINTQTPVLSMATMLVKTNDAFAGVSEKDLSSLALNDTTSFYLNTYDAGTEENSETNTTVPGLGGEGYNAQRESSNMVTLHSGIITQDDGLTTSGLSSLEKFNNPVVKVTITRTN